MIARSSTPQNQLPHPVPVFDSIVQGQESTEASSTDDSLCFWSDEVPSQGINVVDNLLKGVRFGVATLPMASVIEG